MSIESIGLEQILLIVAAVLAVVALFEARGRSLVAWSVLLVIAVLLLL